MTNKMIGVFVKNNQSFYVLFLMIIAFILSILHIEDYFYGYDERATLSCAYGFHFGYENGLLYFTQNYFDSYYNLNGVIKATVADNGNAFAYNTILHFWTYIADTDSFLLHLLSILCFVLSIPLFYGIVIRISNSKFIIYWSMLLFSLHPFFLYMARQIRGYSLALFLTIASTYLLFLILEQNEKKWKIIIPYIFCVSILPLTHYMFGSLILAHFIFVFYQYKIKEINSTPIYIISLALASCFITVCSWLYIGGWEAYVNGISIQLKGWQDHPATFIHYSIQNAASYWSNLLCFADGLILQFMGIRIRTYAILALPIIVLVYLGYTKSTLTKKYKIILILIPSAILFSNFILSLKSDMLISFYPKYNIIMMPFILLTTVAGFAYIETKIRYSGHILLAGILTLYLWSYYQVIYLDHFHVYGATSIEARQKSPYPEIVEQITNSTQIGDTLVFPSWEHASMTNRQLKNYKGIQYMNNSNDPIIFLKNKNRKEIIFDFKNDWARYNYQWN